MARTRLLRGRRHADAPGMVIDNFLAVWFRAHLDDDRAASLVEYALLMALIAVVCIGAITLLGSNVSGGLSTAANSVGN